MFEARIRRSRQARRMSATLAFLATFSAGTAAAADVPMTTPQGITIIEVMRELPISQPEILWLRPGDANGRTLFTYSEDKAGVSNCFDSCADEFPPLAAPRKAKASGDWSLVKRKDGIRQWAYQSRPLYTWTKEEVPGEVATNVGLTETAGAKFAEDEVVAGELMPPTGWQVARFDPAATMVLPDSVDVRIVQAVHAVVLTDADGMTLYVDARGSKPGKYACGEPGCDTRWSPLAAPALAFKGLGDFSVTTRDDGMKQWAYKGEPLYRYDHDELPGDAHGDGVDYRTAAVVTVNYKPPDVSSVFLNGYGSALTLNGMTLYGGYPFEKRWGGRNLRDTFTYTYQKGKRLQGAACVGECLDTWRPFLASDNAKPHGFWEPMRRDDGRTQWAYKGYALYTYEGDDAPGDYYGQATYDFVSPQEAEVKFERVAMLQDISQASGGVGIYWNIAKP